MVPDCACLCDGEKATNARLEEYSSHVIVLCTNMTAKKNALNLKAVIVSFELMRILNRATRRQVSVHLIPPVPPLYCAPGSPSDTPGQPPAALPLTSLPVSPCPGRQERSLCLARAPYGAYGIGAQHTDAPCTVTMAAAAVSVGRASTVGFYCLTLCVTCVAPRWPRAPAGV